MKKRLCPGAVALFASLLAAASAFAHGPSPGPAPHPMRVAQGQSVIPAVFMYFCENGGPARPCPAEDPIYGGGKRMHRVHTWFQIVNASDRVLSAPASRLGLHVYDRNGDPIRIDEACAARLGYSNETGFLDLLRHDPVFEPGEAIFLYLDWCMNDSDEDDTNSAFYAVVSGATPVRHRRESVDLVYQAGAEEESELLDGRYGAKAAVLVDKEVLRLRPRRGR